MQSLLEATGSFRIGPHLIALAVAYLLALPIGWNREKEERSAGLRTFPLVALATCGIVQATEHILAGHPEGTARIIEGLMTGKMKNVSGAEASLISMIKAYMPEDKKLANY